MIKNFATIKCFVISTEKQDQSNGSVFTFTKGTYDHGTHVNTPDENHTLYFVAVAKFLFGS